MSSIMSPFPGKQSAKPQGLCGRCKKRPRVSATRRYCRPCFAEAQRQSVKRRKADMQKLAHIAAKLTGRRDAHHGQG